MPSERIQRQIDRLLDEADDAARRLDWDTVASRAQAALGFDPGNSDAQDYLQIAERNARTQAPQGAMSSGGAPSDGSALAAIPASFVDGRYEVKQFLGEGGKKRVYLAHDTLLDRDVAFALIRTDGLDDLGRERIRREAQAMGRLGAHPHVVSVFDLGEIEGQPFIVGGRRRA